MRARVSTTSFRKLAWLAGVTALPALATAQAPKRIRGVVRDSAGAAVPRAEASIVNDSAIATANDSGVFSLTLHRKESGSVVVRVRRLGYEPLEQPVTVPDSGVANATFTLKPLAQSLAAFHVVAQRRGVWGVVYDQRGVPVPDVHIEMLGAAAKPTVSDSSGAFSLPIEKAGRYLLVARKKGYAYAQTSAVLNPNAGEEAEVILHSLGKADDLASGFGRMEWAFRETSTRLAFKGVMASVVTHDELMDRDATNLSYALCGTEVQMRAGRRCPVQASCVVVNGDHMTALPLEAFDVNEVETVEFYPAPLRRSDQSGSLASRGCTNGSVAVVWLRRSIK